jgi:3',5'-cyclic AMP phosphodiesterase CpdA
VTVTGLLPDTLYAYRVGDGTRWTEWFQFRTASKSAVPFSFLYVGDAQNDILSLWSRVIRQGYKSAPDMRFIIHAGDLVNDANTDGQWGEWFRAGGFIHAMVPSVPLPGNHEYRARTAEQTARGESELSIFWRPQFTLPTNGVKGQEETNYWFDYQGARFVVLNSNRDRAAQATWLRNVLRDNPHPWTIATFHHPIFSAARERDNAELRALWKPVLDSAGVDLVLQGHDHTYARGRTPALGRNVATGVNARDAGTGTVYVVSVSGAKMYDASKDGWGTLGATLDRKAENTQLYQVIRISGDTLRYQARTATGALYDAFDLIRRGKVNRFVERVPRNMPTRTMSSAPPYRVTQPDTAK